MDGGWSWQDAEREEQVECGGKGNRVGRGGKKELGQTVLYTGARVAARVRVSERGESKEGRAKRGEQSGESKEERKDRITSGTDGVDAAAFVALCM